MTRRSSVCGIIVLAACTTLVGAATWTQDFAQSDGPPEGWAVVQPDASVVGEVLDLAPSGPGEPHVFAGLGGNALWFDEVTEIECDLTFPGAAPTWPYDHGGVIFCAQSMGVRTSIPAYIIDWLDGSFRCFNGVDINTLIGGAPSASYEGVWTIQLTPTGFTFALDGAQLFEIADTTYRSGYLGFWCYTNGGQQMAVDNLRVEFAPASCPTLTPAQILTTVPDGNVFMSVAVPFDPARTEPYQVTLTSSAPAVAAPVGSVGGALTLSFPLVGPFSQQVEIEVKAEGVATLAISVPGADCGGIASVVKVFAVRSFCEDFAQADGPPDGWSIVRGDVLVRGEQLTLAPVGGLEASAYVGFGGVPVKFDAVSRIEFDITYPADTASWPYDHGGVIFCAQNADEGRYQKPGPCYVVDYLAAAAGDPTSGRFRCSKFANGVEYPLWSPAATPGLAYEGHWLIELTRTTISFSFDGVPQFTVEDGEYRSGYVGFWAYQAPVEQLVAVDNLCLSFGADPCPTIAPAAREVLVGHASTFSVVAPFGANLDGAYKVKVVSSNPAVARLAGAVGGDLTLSFPPSGGQSTASFELEGLADGTAVLSVTPLGAACASVVEANVRVFAPGFFADDFSQADGAPEKWTPVIGAWQVAGGQLTNDSTGVVQEAVWVFAGVPPESLAAYTLSFDMTLTNQNAGDVVGRHGGVLLCAREPVDRWSTGGYSLDWIDRAEDHGYRASRWEEVPGGPSLQTILATTGYAFELGTHFEIAVTATSIALTVDGVLIGEVEDQTYRGGYFGFFAYNNGTQITIDNVVVGTSGPRAPRASFTANPASGKAPLEVSFDASASTDDGTIASYAWDFGDTASGSGKTATHTYTAAGTYTVKLAVTDNESLTGSAERTVTVQAGGTTFKRGDTNADGRLNIADAVCLLGYLFGQATDPCKQGVPRCLDGADANNDGSTNIADAIKILGHLFAQTGPLPEPFSACGADTAAPADVLDCAQYAPCGK
jgi:hypothetical protein